MYIVRKEDNKRMGRTGKAMAQLFIKVVDLVIG